MIKQIHIYDIDGTLVDSTHRYRTITKPCGSLAIDLPFWVASRHLAMNDILLPLAAQYQAQNSGSEVFTVLATARVMTPAEWTHIATVLGMPDHFISRTDGDTQSGTTLKIKGLEALFSNVPQLADLEGFFYEDNIDYMNGVCNHFNYKGIFCPSEQGY